METKVADLTVQELKEIVREVIIQTLAEMMAGPDIGLEPSSISPMYPGEG